MLLPSPDFFCSCLKFNIEKLGRVESGKIVGKKEPTVRKWLREDDVPEEDYNKIIEHMTQLGNGEFKEEFRLVTEKSPLAKSDAYKWRLFSQGILMHEDALLPHTLREIFSDAVQWLVMAESAHQLEEDKHFGHFKTFVSEVLAPKFNLPHPLKNLVDESKDFSEMKPALAWLFIERFIYFLAMAEVECLWIYYGVKEPKLSNIILPTFEKNKVQAPVKRFFSYFFDNLVSRGWYQSLDDIADNMPRVQLSKQGLIDEETAKYQAEAGVDKENRMRQLKRAKYQGKPIEFHTLRTWIDALIPSEIYPSEENREIEKQLLCDGYAGARILQKFFEETKKDLPEKELLVRFESYSNWHLIHCNAIIEK
ncbi:hypothetical protein SAMN05661003_1128 [Desulfuromonas thiophila]|uniref:Uncharacterized protein n=2 Tax=Desulfuromonas thiophila TaxID=57664 RepID=A0A1G7D568_9BACT|nr:hypothetical protein SAMN05661003_1128 [Desulfuromonas thiophila]